MSAEGPAGRPKALPRSSLPTALTGRELDPVLRAVKDADSRVLLMVVFHLSGDLN
jgi:hypothetical protein